MFENVKWIQGGDTDHAPLFRKEFTVVNAQAAKITLCGLGYFELYVNGLRVGNDLYVPAWSDYQPRTNRKWYYPINDIFSHRAYYLEYDILPYLEDGDNTLGIVLGNGWYHQLDRTAEGEMDYDLPQLCFSLEITDGQGNSQVITSDKTVKWAPSEIVKNNIYMGEHHDLRLCQEGWNKTGFDDSGWEFVRIAPAPDTRFFPQTCPTDKVIRTLNPVLVHDNGQRRIYDCGENITGYVILRVPSQKNERITVRHSEELNEARDELDFTSAGGDHQIQTDEYICSDFPAVCHPRFCWHGFRYFDITGETGSENPEVAVVHADVPVSSSFECSDPTLNWLYNTYIRTQLGNIHGGVISDCPHRERLGYTGDGQITADACMLCLDSRTVYDKWMEDIADGQDPETGHVQHTAPFYGGGGGPGGWGGAIFIIPFAYYRAYGDVEVLRRYYPNMLLWLDYMHSRTEQGLVTREEEGGWCLGEWCTPDTVEIPESFVNTYYYIRGLREVRNIGTLLGDTEAHAKIDQRLAEAEAAFMASFFDKKTGSFCGGVNAADAFAVDLGLGDERTLAELIEKYSRTKTLDTGIFGTDLLIDMLFRHQQADLAYTLLTRETEASFARMRKAGATTLWETWTGKGSHNHPMFGGVVRTFFQHILGIRQTESSAGYSEVVISPADIAELSWAKGWITTPAGKISVDYEKDAEGKLIVRKNIPAGIKS